MIPIELEPEEFWGEEREQCALCGALTRYWRKTSDVTLNVAICPTCAASHEEVDAPDRDIWFTACRTARKNKVPFTGCKQPSE